MPRGSLAGLLPQMSALYNVMSSSRITPQPVITSSFCTDPRSLFSITISCSDKADDTGYRHITGISMQNQYLGGVIDEEVAQLTYLESLDLSNNKLYGAIPASLGNLSQLKFLDLSSNLLTGSVPPSLGNLKNLANLYLIRNLLDGTIPPSLGELSNLEYLWLTGNRLSGEIPGELGNLSKLLNLDLEDNELIGKLPPELGNLSNLENLWLESNNLTGELPTEYVQLKQMFAFTVGGNYLEGPIPAYIASWDNLTRLHLLGNNFEGKLPDEIFRMQSLRFVSDLRNTGFYFPKSTKLTNIYSLVLRNCSIMGEIPSDIGNWSSLQNLFLTSNMLSGKIPDWINKTVIVSGDFPENASEYETFSDQTIINVTLSHTFFLNLLIDLTACVAATSHPINRTSLYQIGNEGCYGKKLKQRSESRHGGISTIATAAHDNHFVLIILFHADSLFINAGGEETIVNGNHYDADNTTSNTLYVSSEKHWASICTGYFVAVTTNRSDYVRNITCGVSVPEAPLYAKARLCPQSLSYYGFCLRKGNYNVTLHFVEIIFSKDEDHSSTGKRVFDVYIQGNRVLKDFNIKRKAGGPDKIWTENFIANVKNDHLLEIHLFWAGKGSIYNHPALNGPLISAISVSPNFKVGGLSKVEIIGIVIAAVSALLLLLAFIGTMIWLRDRELRVANIEIRGKFYCLKQVKDATGNFTRKNEIGKGQFGIVYKAELPDKNIVAVKKLSKTLKFKLIGTEVYAFKQKNLRHENIVELLAISSTDDLNLIIYEYMERGSLEQVLFAPESATGQADTNKADVYSYGILLLEIVSGKSNSKHEQNQETTFLLNTARICQKRKRLLDLVDPILPSNCRKQALQILDLAMECISPSHNLRPTMSDVVNKLTETENQVKEMIQMGDSAAAEGGGDV
ncbi:hypothetical protein Patl1_09740 [Pistacia atlantica]|uniref:Uncharacterized protein n=1 Tax=Pistacia atlantica TaxID=434234 RepID=A0ACC1A2Y1_9ROSI|nr:hypothetical protein Patl1_09740 [Pistacia atlantica]